MLEGLLPLVIPEGEIITLERVNIISWRDRAGLFQGLVGDHREQRFLGQGLRSEEHTSELQSLMRISYAVFCLKKKQHILYHIFSSLTMILTSELHNSNTVLQPPN